MRYLLVLLMLIPIVTVASQGNLAVLPLDMTGGVPETYQLTLTDRLSKELIETGVYSVMERYKVEEILSEQAFSLAGCVSTECAVEVGKMLGVHSIVAGSVGKVGSTYSINARLIDVETSQIVRAKSVDYRGEIDQILTHKCRELAYLLADQVLPDSLHYSTSEDEYETWSIGSKMADVCRIEGSPVKVETNASLLGIDLGAKTWYYGDTDTEKYSIVRFTVEGKVKAFDNSAGFLHFVK